MNIKNILKFGVIEDMDLENRKRVMFSNGVYTIVGSLILLQEVVTGVQTFIPFLLIGLSVFCLFLNSIQLYLPSRFLFMLGITFFSSVFPVLHHGPGPVSYFTHPIYVIIISPVIHLLFSRQKEPVAFFFFLMVSFLLTLFSIDFLLAFDRSPEPKVPLVSSIDLMRISFTVIWLFINLLMAYVMKINWDFYSAIQEQKEIVGQQRLLLQLRNEELSEANKELIHLNKQIRELNDFLEKSVVDRTRELTDRNKTLSDYAFMNAHLLRSPVSRIKGLINLFQITSDLEEKKKVQEILSQSAEDLDQVVHSINKKLNETG